MIEIAFMDGQKRPLGELVIHQIEVKKINMIIHLSLQHGIRQT